MWNAAEESYKMTKIKTNNRLLVTLKKIAETDNNLKSDKKEMMAEEKNE